MWKLSRFMAVSGGIEVGVVIKIEFHIGLQDCRVLVVQMVDGC